MDVTFFEEVPFYTSSSPTSSYPTPPLLPVPSVDLPTLPIKRFADPPRVYISKPTSSEPPPVFSASTTQFADPPIVYTQRTPTPLSPLTNQSDPSPDSGLIYASSLLVMDNLNK